MVDGSGDDEQGSLRRAMVAAHEERGEAELSASLDAWEEHPGVEPFSYV